MTYFRQKFTYKSSVINHWLRAMSSCLFTKEDALGWEKYREFKIKDSFKHIAKHKHFLPLPTCIPKRKRAYVFRFLLFFFVRLQKLIVFSCQLLDQFNSSDIISLLKLAHHPCLKSWRKSEDILKSTVPGHDTTAKFTL